MDICSYHESDSFMQSSPGLLQTLCRSQLDQLAQIVGGSKKNDNQISSSKLILAIVNLGNQIPSLFHHHYPQCFRNKHPAWIMPLVLLLGFYGWSAPQCHLILCQTMWLFLLQEPSPIRVPP